MLTNMLFFMGGLVVGWNFLAQPEFVRNIISSIREKIGL